MGFPGTWMTESESVVYRVVPKCACSTIGKLCSIQIMVVSLMAIFMMQKDGMHKWALEASHEPISKNVTANKSYAFTCVRNPYTRILSSFSTKYAAFNATAVDTETLCRY